MIAVVLYHEIVCDLANIMNIKAIETMAYLHGTLITPVQTQISKVIPFMKHINQTHDEYSYYLPHEATDEIYYWTR